MRRPDLVYGHFAGVFVHGHFSHLGRVGVRGRRSDSCPFMFAATGIGRRGVGNRSGESAVEIDGGDYGFFEGHPIFRAFVFAFLLQRAAENLSFDAATDRGSRLSNIVIRSLGNDWRGASLLIDEVAPKDQVFGRAVHLASGCQSNLLFHFCRGAQCGVARHEGYAAGIGADVDGREGGGGGDDLDPSERAAQHFGGDLSRHGARALPDFRCSGVHDDSAVAVDLDVPRGVGHVRANDRICRAAYVVAAGDAQAAALRQLALALFPTRARNNFFDALGQSVTLHAETVHRDARRLEQIALTNLGGIHSHLGCKFVQLRFEGESYIHGAVAAHRSANRLVGQDAVAVILNVGDVVQRAQQRAGIENGYDAIGAIGSAILHDSCLDGGDAAVVGDSSLEIDNRAGASAVRPEDFFAGVGNFHWGKRFSCRNRCDYFEWDDFTFTAKASAYQRLDDANLRHRHFEHQGQLVLQVVRNLG